MPNFLHTQNGFGTKGNDFVIFPNAGVPSGTTGVGFAGKGSICVDITNANIYINAGTMASPVWKLVTRAA